MPGLIRALFVLAAALVALPARAQTPDEVSRGRAAYRDGVAAWRAGDRPAFLEHMTRAHALRPDHPGILYALASAHALNGHDRRAVAILDTLAAMGLAYDAASDPDFSTLAPDPGFRRAAARMAANAGPLGSADTALRIPEADFVPEGVARDAATGWTYVASVHRRTVVRARGDEVETFVPTGADGLWSALGLAIDPGRRILWAGSAALPETRGVDPDEIGRTGLFGWDLDSGRLVARVLLPADGARHALGDLAVGPGGRVWASDGWGGGLWVLEAGADSLTAVVPPGTLVSPQGIAPAADGRRLWVADYSLGILAVDPAAGTARLLGRPGDLTLLGIDGLVRAGDDLVAVQNGIAPARVVRLRLGPAGDSVRSWEVLAAGLDAFDEPTLGTVIGDRFVFVANSHWNRFEDGRLPEGLSPPLLLSIPLSP